MIHTIAQLHHNTKAKTNHFAQDSIKSHCPKSPSERDSANSIGVIKQSPEFLLLLASYQHIIDLTDKTSSWRHHSSTFPLIHSFPSINQSIDVCIYFGDEIEDIELSTTNYHPKMRQFLACSACPNPIGNGTATKYIKEYEGNGGFSDEMKLGGTKGKTKEKIHQRCFAIISCLTDQAVKSQ